MPWHKPKAWWQWLLLLGPGTVSVAMTAFGKVALSRKDEVGPSILGVLIVLPLCVVIAFYFAPGTDSAAKMIGLAILFTAILVIVNFSIAFAGCAFMPPYVDFR